MPRTASRLALAGLVVLTACTASQAEVPPPAPTVDLTMQDYRFEVPGELPPGRVVLDVANAGEENHDLTVVALPEDFPATFEEHFATGQRRPLGTVVFLSPLEPGETDILALDLAPGRYGLLCTLETPDGVAHSRLGMATQIRVR